MAARFGRFLVVGLGSVATDAAVYALLLALGVVPWIAKPTGYLAGTVVSYFGNWRFTFGARRGRFSEVAFGLVYLSSLAINVGINQLGLAVLDGWTWRTVVVFLVTTAITTVWNFVGMALFVFRTPDGAPTVSTRAAAESEEPI